MHRHLTVTVTGTGPQRVVFLHGVLDRGRSFEPVTTLLSEECTSITYDRRGYGRAVDAPGAPVDHTGHVDDLLEILGEEPAIIAAHSFGGVTALATALARPDLVLGLALYETGMAWLDGWDDSTVGPLVRRDDAAERAVQLMFGDRYHSMDAPERALRLRQGAAFVAEEGAVRRGEPPFDVAQLQCPLVYGYGGNDHFEVACAHLRAVVADVEIVVIEGAGHNAHLTHPEAFAELVRRVIRRTAGRSAT